MNNEDPEWKLKLRYGRTSTAYRHFTVISNGRVCGSNPFGAVIGPSYMGMKVWASSESEAADMIEVIGRDLLFEVRGKIEVFVTVPAEPPRENPHGYDIKFTPYKEEEPELDRQRSTRGL